MNKENLLEKLEINAQIFLNFISKIQTGYTDITYHNKTHAADLSSTAYYYCKAGGFEHLAKLDAMELAAMLIGGACHDHEH